MISKNQGTEHKLTKKRRRRREAINEMDFSDITYSDMLDDEDRYEFRYDMEPWPTIPVSWPTRDGITEQEAEDECRRLLGTSDIHEVCSLVEGIDVMGPLERCIDDIRVSTNIKTIRIVIKLFKPFVTDHTLLCS